MSNLLKKAKEHWVGIAAALAIGLLISLPNIIFIHSPAYKGVPIFEEPDQQFYLARINAAERGCIMSCNPYIKEYGSTYPSFDPSISEAILALPGVIFSISAPRLEVFYQFLLPFLLGILTYFLIWRLTKRRLLSAVGTLFMYLGYSILNARTGIDFSSIWDLFVHFAGTGEVQGYARAVNPEFSSIIFLGFLHTLLSFIRNPSKKTAIIASIVYGFCFYVYFYLFAFATAVLSILVLIYLFRKSYKNFFYSLGILFIGLLIGSPIIKELWNLIHNPLYKDIPIVQTLPGSHMPNPTFVGLILLLSISLLILAKTLKQKGKISKDFVFIGTLILACFAVLNQNVITGLALQSFHFEWYYITPVFIIALCFLLAKSRLKLHPLFLAFLIFIPILNALATNYVSYKYNYPQTVEDQNYAPVLSWLDKNTAKGSIVYSDNFYLMEIIPAYTSDFVYWSYYASGFLTPKERRDDIGAGQADSNKLLSNFEKYNVSYAVIERNDAKDEALFKQKPVYEDSFYDVYKIGIITMNQHG